MELDVVAGDSEDVQVVELDGLNEGQVESFQPVGSLEDLGTDLHPGRKVSQRPNHSTQVLGCHRNFDKLKLLGTTSKHGTSNINGGIAP